MATSIKYAEGVSLGARQAYMFGGRLFVQCKEAKCTSMVLEGELMWCDRHVPLCAICLEDINLKSVDICGHGHWFHVDCVANMNRMQCPYCRRPPTQETRQIVIKKKTEKLIEKVNRLPSYVQEAFLEHALELVNEL
jgi:hypothetical protein